MFKSGQIKEKITEDRLKMYLEQMTEKKKESKIIVRKSLYINLLYRLFCRFSSFP